MLKNRIRNISDAKQFIVWLVEHDKLFHFEDCPHEIVNVFNGTPTFTATEADCLKERVTELYDLDWPPMGYECPIDLALEIANSSS